MHGKQNTLVPVRGAGLHASNLGEYQALGVYDEFGDTPKAAGWLRRNKIEPEAQATAVRIYEAIQR